MKSEQRLILFCILSFVILFFYGKYVNPPLERISVPAAENKTQTELVYVDKKEEEINDSHKKLVSLKDSLAKQAETVELDLSWGLVSLTNHGARIDSYVLRDFETPEGDKVDLVFPRKNFPTNLPTDFVDKLGVHGDFGSDSNILYNIKVTGKRVDFHAVHKGWILEKSYEFFDQPYLFDFHWRVENPKNSNLGPMTFKWGPDLGQGMDLREKSLGVPGGALRYTWRSIEKARVKNKAISSKKDKTHDIPLSSWFGLRSRYFMFLWLPAEPGSATVIEGPLDGDYVDSNGPVASLGFSVPRNQGSSKVYFGPSVYGQLSQEPYSRWDLGSAVEFGYFWLRPLAIGMLHILNFFFDWTNNYGFAIVLLTLVVKMLLWYPSQKSQVSMKKTQIKMKAIQPRLESIKRKHKGDSQKMSSETMKLYKEHGINPGAGCLPMLLQMPIMFALYWTLASAIELRGAGTLWIGDLSQPDPTKILPIIMGVGMLAQTLLAGSMAQGSAASQQKMIMIFMPIFFTAISFSLPSGLILYWAFLNVLSIIQTYLINKKLAVLEPGK